MKNDDMPAMPYIEQNNGQTIIVCEGLTKREHFAALAMQAYISGNTAWSDGLDGGSALIDADDAAKEAVLYADALLKALEDK